MIHSIAGAAALLVSALTAAAHPANSGSGANFLLITHPWAMSQNSHFFAGAAALLVSVLTAAALVAHLAYSGSGTDWSLAGLRLGRRPKATEPPASPADASNLTQRLCNGGASAALGGGSGSGSGGTGSGSGSGVSASVGAATADQALMAALPKSWAAGHIAHDVRHWRRTGIQKEAVDRLAAAQDKYKVHSKPLHRNQAAQHRL